MQTDFDIPAWVATCPHNCGGTLHLEVDEWEADGMPTEAGCHVSCDGETEQEDDPHWQMPYVTLLPLEHTVWLWAKDNIRIVPSEEETREKRRQWEAGEPIR